MRHADVIVIGAGIVGAACAHELAGLGMDVLVLDARGLRGPASNPSADPWGSPFAAATDAGMGHLVVMDDDAAEFALSRQSLDIWREWAPRMDADCAFSRCGTLWVAADAQELQLAEDKHARLAAQGVASQMLGAAALAQAEPALRPGLAGGLRVGGDSIVYAPKVARWLLAAAPRAIRLEAAEVLAVAEGQVRLSDGTVRGADAIVLAAGVQARRLCPELPIHPKKGHLLITDRYPGLVRHQLVELGYVASAQQADGASVAFNVQPRPTGQLLIGSSRQFDCSDAAVQPAMLSRMLQRALHYLPALADCSALRAWTGLRPATPDGLPLIGAHTQRPGLWLALGHEGLGITTAPGTARLLGALLRGVAPALDAAPFRAQRFAALACQADGVRA